ncbi:MAG: tetratricopeptide repeat protein [Candidatus Omnitrophica bacterium]|nr:tetratricopeptide repeat protein [Candidatus Omnitrophota bacterium]MBU0896059.1 tetratricopeptide repeat protein [Candidatus Omnitrophota bacterium]MBU1134609.1 tetratricopeptide repeat protein [Candidatus Omnitrophota bacterium]MBU1366528.1 tetratricopeptide repeat protein [Candidatus Omnitrophota bacterium]MBU1524242.1 tetratricopeptide repeat protein [Candidatus Omnitrophota bacterium]
MESEKRKPKNEKPKLKSQNYFGIVIFLVIGFLFWGNCFAQQNDRTANYLFTRGLDYYNQADYELAAYLFRKALAVSPDHQGAKNYLKLISQSEKPKKIEQTLDKIEAESGFQGRETFGQKQEAALLEEKLIAERKEIIKKTLRRIAIEISMEYLWAKGEQSFELLNSQGEMVSKLTYPVKGKMTIFKGEVGFLSKFFLGARYGSSDFKKTVCSDEDWNIHDPTWPYGSDDYVDYQITKQGGKSEVEFFDINFYYRLLDLDKEYTKQKHLSSEGDTIFDSWVVDNLSLDIFTGYQQQKGRYGMIDPMSEYLRFDEDTWYYATGLPANIGLDSFYKIKYKGPRIGLRAKGSKGKITTKVWFAYAWLKTEAHGWWNLRDLAYWQKGENGSGVDLGFEITYPFTSSFSAGIGFNYFQYWQKKLKMYAVEAGTPWWEGYQDRIRNADSRIYGPSLVAKFIW